MRTFSIGVFDSGLGGLSVLKDILDELPQYNYIYFGDNARVPYSGKSPELIYEYTRKAVDFLMKKNCLLVILACNTATATSLPKIQREYLTHYYPERRVLGIIRPTVEAIVEKNSKRVGIMATYATVISKSFVAELKKLDDKIDVYQNACPLLVPVIEEGEVQWEGLHLLLQKYLAPLKKKNIDTLVLGCTHYGLIDEKIRSLVGPSTEILSEGKVTAQKLKKYLKKHRALEKKLAKAKKRAYYVTDLNERYKKMAKFFLGKSFSKGDKILEVKE
jgi:glutamate racemase